jgi:hypothetical protein
VPAQPLSPYHIGQQQAVVLLGPVEAELGQVAARVGHYAARLRMSDDDRAVLAQAERAVTQARDAIAQLRGRGA